MHVVMTAIGTRGDAQPFVAIGKGLRDAGYRVTIATHDDFREMVEGNGLGFRPMFGSFKAILETEQGRAWIESGDSYFRYKKTFRATFYDLQRRWFDAEDIVADADAVISHPLAWGPMMAAEKKGVPTIVAPAVPMVPTRSMPPIFVNLPNVSGWLNRKLAALALRDMTSVFWDVYEEQRAALGLDPLPSPDIPGYYIARGAPHLHLYSEHLQPRPDDWPETAHVTGFCFLDSPAGASLPDDVEQFLASGPPPVYVGFGSMTGKDPEELAHLALDAVHTAGVRAIIVSGWGGLTGLATSDDVLVATDVPHDLLFPRCSAVVHHGGAGTVSAGLRAGKPTVVTAFFGDQPYWGRRVAALGAGPRAIQRRELTAARLAESIRVAVDDPAFRHGAERLSRALTEEDGVGRAVELVERYVGAAERRSESQSGDGEDAHASRARVG